MIEVVLRGLRIRTTRTVLTGLAVVLGVAMISGTFVLMDTTMSAYSDIFRAAYVEADAVVVAEAPFGPTGTTKPTIPADLVDEIRALPEVERAHGYIDAHAQLTEADGTPIGTESEEASLFGIPTGDLDAMNPLSLVRGAWPDGEGAIVIDEATATANDLRIGATVGLVARQPLERYEVVGIVRFADAETLGPIQFAAVDLPVAQRIFDKPAGVDEIDVAARPGTSIDTLLAAPSGPRPARPR